MDVGRIMIHRVLDDDDTETLPSDHGQVYSNMITHVQAISPEAIAGSINESLRQQFVRSTIPQTAEALGRISADMKKVAAEFVQTAGNLSSSYTGAAAAAKRAVDDMQSSITRAADTARRATEKLSTTFHREYRWSLYALSGFGFIVGLAFGMWIEAWFNPPQKQYVRDPIQVNQPAPKVEIPMPVPVPKKRR